VVAEHPPHPLVREVREAKSLTATDGNLGGDVLKGSGVAVTEEVLGGEEHPVDAVVHNREENHGERGGPIRRVRGFGGTAGGGSGLKLLRLVSYNRYPRSSRVDSGLEHE